MLARTLGRIQPSSLLGKPQAIVGTRGMATEKQLKSRMKAIQGIGKIAKAMRMVSLAKLKRSQEQLERSRTFAKPVEDIWPENVERTKEGYINASNANYLLVPIVADRGLCGGANSSITRMCRRVMQQVTDDKPASVQIVVMGEKGRGGLERLYKKHFATTVSDWGGKGKFLPFRQVSELAQYVISLKFDKGEFVYNRFKNALVFITTSEPIVPFEKAVEEAKFDNFELEGDELLQNLYEFRTAVRMFHYFAENETAELSARMTAMGNSSKSADEMLSKVKLLYNRNRQSRITTELVEIIGGVVSL